MLAHLILCVPEGLTRPVSRIARLLAPCPSHKKLKHKNFNILLTDANINPTANAGGIAIALPVHSYRQVNKFLVNNSVKLKVL